MGLESYDLGEIVAQSPHSVVRRAVRRTDGEAVVIKLHTKEYPTTREIGQLEFEHRLLRALRHPTVVREYELLAVADRLALVLEDFGASDLSVRLGRIPLDLFLTVAIGVARGLEWIHSRGVIHKDVTPRNVLLNPATRQVKLIDFGIATELSQERQVFAGTNDLEGTLPYISPEQTGRMNRDLDYRSDYYSLGATLFELLTGTLPFSAPDTMGWVHCHISRPAPSPRDVDPTIPQPVADIVSKLLAKDPDERYQSSHGLIADLEACERQWTAGRAIAPFRLGYADVPERFQVSQRLFGRQAEVVALHEAFEEASAGPAKLLLVAGYSGVGKSALIHELQKDVVRGRGHFIGGKFDQIDRSLPYGAVVQALRALVKQLLGEPEEVLATYKRKFGAAMGPNGQVLVELVPELEGILGPQPPVPALAPREAHTRLHRAFGDLLRGLATADHPIVLFLDDLQWADPATLELIEHLLCDEALRYLLVIGSYRDNEVQPGHSLRLALNRIFEKRHDVAREIVLRALSEDDVNLLVADTLHCDPESCRSVAAVIAQKTGGNPFFIKELLNLLARDGAFRFVPEQGRWGWDEGEIEKAAVSDNVVDLMVQRLRRLPAETIEVLRLAACIGNDFDLSWVSRIAGKPAGQVATALFQAVRERVLVPVSGAYRLVHDGRTYDEAGLSALSVRYQFQHDRVQQAAYSLVDAAEGPHVHLAIGRLLLATSPATTNEPPSGRGFSFAGLQSDDRVFETVNHLNLGRALLSDGEERRALSRLNESAAVRAQKTSAYAVAAAYFEAALELLTPDERAADAQRVFDCERGRAECIFHSGDPERAESLCALLVESAPDRWAKIAALELKAQILQYQARLLEAIATLRQGLRLVGVELPEAMDAVGALIGEGIGKMQAHLARVPVEELVNLPEMTDREKVTTTRLLFHLVVPAIQACPPLFVLAELMMFDLALTAGITHLSCKNFVDCGIIQGPTLGDYDRAYRLGKVAFELLKRETSRHLGSAVSFVFAAFVSHWRAPYRESLQAFADAERLGAELGDNNHLTYALALSMQRWFFVGRPLPECEERAAGAAARLTRLRATNQRDGLRLVERAVARLRGTSLDETDDEFTARLEKAGNAQWLFLHAHAQCLISLVHRDYELAARWDAFARQHEAGGRIQYAFPDHHALRILVMARKLRAAAPDERKAYDTEIDANLARLQTWAESCPANYAPKHRIAAAEVARARGEPLERVLSLHDEAMHLAGDDFLPWRALANELQAEHWSACGQPKLAPVFAMQAARLYEKWGATVKVRQMGELRPNVVDFPAAEVSRTLRVTGSAGQLRTDAFDMSALDLQSMIKATQAISSEVKRERLLARLMATIVENAGAQRGCLVARDEMSGELRVEARSSLEDSGLDARQRVPIAECAELSPDIVRYVARTGKTVVVDDAVHDEAYRDDPHVREHLVKSVLCTPILHQSKLVAVLYAENNVATHAFTPQRIRLLQVIASQAAISITNARLYDSLEERVEERTRELAHKNREIAAMLDSMQQGVFTIDQNLQIQTQYSAHLEAIVGTGPIAGSDLIPLLFRDSNVDADALRRMRAALQFSFGVAPVVAEGNWSHLVRQFQRVAANGERQHFEADWTVIADDHGIVCKILVAVRDVTVLKTLTESVARKARELAVIGQILDSGVVAFERFAASARVLLGENMTVLAAPGDLARADAELLFRNMHTLKGNSRMLGLSYLVEAAHEAEQVHDRDRRGDAPSDRARLGAALGRVGAVLEEYEAVYERKVMQLRDSADTRSTAALAEIGTVLRSVSEGSLSSPEAICLIGRAMSQSTAASLGDIVRETGRMLPSLARELEKAPPEVDCADDGARLNVEWAQVLRDVLVHAFRNAIDHGIEPPAIRERQGKRASGRIAVCYRSRERGAEVVVSDDGRGLDLTSLRAVLHGVACTDEELADKAFVSGVSTASQVSSTSGRGIGMDAIRSSLRKHGGDARIVLTGPEQQGFRTFDLVIELPESALDGRDPSPERPVTTPTRRSVPPTASLAPAADGWPLVPGAGSSKRADPKAN
jgi:predicted ATPase/HPt (histidine-containing phosphotransfer) domain-containing protein